MKKFLLSLSAFVMASGMMMAADAEPKFPDSFNVTLSSPGPEVTQGVSMGVYTISVKGVADAETLTMTIEVPEGWDGIIGICDSDMEDPGAQPLNKVKMKAADDDEEWFPIDAMIQYGMKKSNSFTFPVDGDEYLGQFYLYANDMAYGKQVAIEFEVEKGVPVLEPVFPESIGVTTNPSSLDVEQIPAEEFMGEWYPLSITVQGTIKEPTATITLEIPEGWTNFIGTKFEFSPFSGAKVKSEWESKADLLEAGYVEGNVIEVAADGMYHTYNYYLCDGDRVDRANVIEINIYVNRDLSDLVYPATFDVKLSAEGPKVEQNTEVDMDMVTHNILISGECEAEKLTVTLTVPEGWDGFIGASDSDMESNVEPLRAMAAEDEEEEMPLAFYPLSYLENGDVPVKKGNTFEFPADGELHYAMCYLYKDEMFCDRMINIEVSVNEVNLGVANIEAADSEVRYFNLQGVEVLNPENGVYVKVANGKASKVTLK